MKIKLCGFNDKKSIKAAIANKCDFIGFIFYDKSPRNVTLQQSVELAKNINGDIAKVAVVVDENFDKLSQIYQQLSPDYFQFHGNETPEFLKKVKANFNKVKIIKAFRISDVGDLEFVKNFEDCADLFLFDAKNPGSGKSFDWKIMQNLNTDKDWFLSGGLNSNNVKEAIAITGAKMIDVSSGIEFERGEKSIELINQFMTKVSNLKLPNIL